MVHVHLGPRTRSRRQEDARMRKLVTLALLALVGYVVFQQVEASKAEQDLWAQATSE